MSISIMRPRLDKGKSFWHYQKSFDAGSTKTQPTPNAMLSWVHTIRMN